MDTNQGFKATVTMPNLVVPIPVINITNNVVSNANNREPVLNIYHTNVQSYRVVAESICHYMNAKCNIQPHERWMFSPVDVFIGSQSDMIVRQYIASKARVVYVTVEGKYKNQANVESAKQICKSRPCIAVTKWGKAIFEEQGIPVADYMYHPIPPISAELVQKLRGQPRPFEAVYLNNRYQLTPQHDPMCERKGWHFWRDVYSQFNSIGFIGNGDEPNAIRFSSPDIADVYKLLALGRIYTNLAKHEGFGLNPVMALYVGTKVVTWNAMAMSETLDGIEGVYFVPANQSKTCELSTIMHGTGDALIEYKWGDIRDYMAMVKTALSSTASIDYAALESRFGGHVVKVLAGYLR
jgi:hypothetical protein